MKAATKDIGLAAAKGAASEAGKQALDAAVVQPLKLVGAVAEVGCQLTPLGLFNMGLGIANLAIGATSLGVGIFNAYQVLKVKNDLGALQLQTTSIGVKTQEGLEKTQEGLENVAAEVRSVGVGLSADISRLSSQLGGLVIAEGEQTRVALREVKEQLNLRLHRVDLVLGWVGTLVTVLGEQQGALSQQLAELHEDLRRGFQGLHALHKSAEQEEFQASIALVADIYRDVLFELQSGGGSAEECQELQRASKRLAAWTSSKLGRYALGDLRRAPLMVARVYALVTEVDARILGEMLTGGSGSALEGLTAEDSPHRRLCVQKLATLAREVELEARALIATQASSAYALAVDVAPILSQYALLHRSIEAKQGAGRPVIFELQEASLAAGEPHVAVRWDDGLANMRVLCSIMASDKKYEPGGSDKMELRTVADVLWLAEVLERHPEECLLADMHSIKKRVLLDALGVPERLGDGSKLEGTELAALRALSLPHLREAVEDAVNASFGSLEMPLTLPTWSEVAGNVKEALQWPASIHTAEHTEDGAKEHAEKQPAARLAEDEGGNHAEEQPAARLAEEWREKGNVQYNWGNFTGAEACYTRSLTYSRTAAALSNRAMSRNRLGQFREAEKDASAAILEDPKYVKAYHRRAAARRGLNKKELAMEDYKVVLEAMPNNAGLQEEIRSLQESILPSKSC